MRAKLISIALPVFALSGGCELAGALIAAEVTKDDEPGEGTASLSVVVESASGEVRGRTLTPEMFEPSGNRFGHELDFDLAAGGDFAIQAFVSSVSSEDNPYTSGGRGESGNVFVCEGSSCQNADDFAVEIVQTEDGRRAFIDGLWNGTETAAITLHFTEE